jgi:hypothetical protein
LTLTQELSNIIKDMKYDNTPYILTDSSLTLFFVGKAPKSVSSDHANFKLLVEEVNKPIHDIKKLEELSSIETAVRHYMKSADSESNITISDGEVFYRGRPVHNVVVDKILGFMARGHNYQPLVNFLERLLLNPSMKSVEELYPFLENGNMPLTPEGYFMGYKGVKDSYFSHVGNNNTVVLKGEVDSGGHIKNNVGAEIEIERNSVCDDRGIGCGPGVHAGSFEYAKGWAGTGGRLILVKIDPAKVVSVPDCSKFAKLRCCGYTVVDEITENKQPLEEELVSNYTQEDLTKAFVDGFETGKDEATGYAITEAMGLSFAFDDGFAAGEKATFQKATLSANAKAQIRGKNGRFKKSAKKSAKKSK